MVTQPFSSHQARIGALVDFFLLLGAQQVRRGCWWGEEAGEAGNKDGKQRVVGVRWCCWEEGGGQPRHWGAGGAAPP